MTLTPRKCNIIKRPRPLLVLLLSGMAGVTSSFTRPVPAEASPDTQATSAPAIVRNDFQSVSGPVRAQGVTGAEECGSYVRDAALVRELYSFEGIEESAATVQVVTFPGGYSYVGHDAFCSLLRTAAYDETHSGRGDPSAAGQKVRCTLWEFTDGTKGGNICYVHRPASELGPTGSVRWIADAPERGMVSVGIGYRNLSGLPGQLIDKYLREYPSTVPENPTWHIDWETRDLEKWAAVLRANQDDLQILQAGAAYLFRYDKRSFGLLDALKKRDDAAAYSQALEQVSKRMSQVVEERKTARDRAEHDE